MNIWYFGSEYFYEIIKFKRTIDISNIPISEVPYFIFREWVEMCLVPKDFSIGFVVIVNIYL